MNGNTIDAQLHPTEPPGSGDAVVNILVVCTANQCRSPMAAALLDRELVRCGIPARVQSAGTSAVADIPPTDDAIAVMSDGGIDISAHRSRPVMAGELDAADVVIAMTRAHLRDLATRSPAAFPRVYTLKELARRAQELPRDESEPIRPWITRLGAERRTTDLLGDDPDDDVEDPIGRPLEVYATVAAELADALSRFVSAGWCRSDERL